MREAQRMVSEKALAAMEGAWGMGMAWWGMALRLGLGGMQPAEVRRGLVKMADAAEAPARRAVRGNARRLTTRRRRRR
jgi:hypothetical protein